ncbi:MAG: twin-arginine translocase TatA/TatE family subunit, partial [Verrucomicrobia bacterium]|nr:twin-arginine translocase TatA/TatE family subunit [Verrucomicrobiota bacterium]
MMIQEVFQLAFIGPGGPEILVVMLVLLLMFGAKDAPRIFRKLNEIINQIRNSADGFKREVLYGDLATDSVSDEDYDSGH